MSQLVLHAIAERADRPPASGLGGQPLVWIGDRELGAWASVWTADRPPGREEMLAHHEIVAAVHALGACLPVRFGTLLPDPSAAAQRLESRRGALLAGLARVRGRCELVVTLVWREAAAVEPANSGQAGVADSAPAGDAGPGRRYLEARRRVWSDRETRRERAEAHGRALLAEAGVAPGDARLDVCPGPRVALSAALLAPRRDAPARLARLGGLADRWEDVDAVVNGPWPPYSFAGVA